MKRTISASLTVVVAAGTLAACGGGASSPDTKAGTAGDNKGPTKFSISYPTTVSTGYHTRIPDLNKDKWVLKLGELTNTSLNIRIMEDAKMSLMFAGNDIPDVVGNLGTPTNKWMSGSVEAGVASDSIPIWRLMRNIRICSRSRTSGRSSSSTI